MVRDLAVRTSSFWTVSCMMFATVSPSISEIRGASFTSVEVFGATELEDLIDLSSTTAASACSWAGSSSIVSVPLTWKEIVKLGEHIKSS